MHVHMYPYAVDEALLAQRGKKIEMQIIFHYQRSSQKCDYVQIFVWLK